MKNEKKKAVLFVCERNEGRLAETLFETEAKRMDLGWGAVSRTVRREGIDSINPASDDVPALQGPGADALQRDQLPEPVTLSDLQNSDLTILVLSDSKLVQQQFPSWKGETEHWPISSASDSTQLIRQSVSNLVVRLILKSGKRPALPSAPPVQQQHQETTGAKQSVIRVALSSKGRKGKKVTLVSGLPLNEAALEELAFTLKQICGSGGTVKDGQIEIQGDHRDRIMAQLQNRGYKPKRAGG